MLHFKISACKIWMMGLMSWWIVAGWGQTLHAQESIQDSTIRLIGLDLSYHGLIPGGDMGGQYGFNSQIGAELIFKGRHNWYATVGWYFLFSDSVTQPGVIDPLLVPGNFAIGDNGLLSAVGIMQRGVVIPLAIGKIIPIVKSHNPNSGLFVELGGQFIQHKIHLRAIDERVTLLTGEYRKGYDQMANGFGIREMVGYRYFSKGGNVNFAAGFVFSQNFTRNRRSVNFITGQQDNSMRLDLLSGFRVAWTYAFYRRAPESSYFR
ncbi:MAG: hypothetical protein AAFV07_00315 [Bacteroidota bacterium]